MDHDVHQGIDLLSPSFAFLPVKDREYKAENLHQLFLLYPSSKAKLQKLFVPGFS